MTCDEFENRFLAGQENQLSVEVRSAGEEHLAGCSACQTFARQLQQLDEALAMRIKAPVLSADFNQRLANRIQAGTTVLSETQRAERKRQLQAEYEAGLEQIRDAPLRLTGVLDGFQYVALAALAGGLGWQFLPGLITFLTAQGLGGLNRDLLLAAAAGAVFLTIGLAATFPRTFRQLSA